jgi:hypothetical protein
VSAQFSKTARPRPAAVRRSRWLRSLALLITLLGIAAQQRLLTPAVRPSASVARLVTERVQSIESHAVRVEAAVRVVAAPVLARVPRFVEPLVVWPRLVVLACCVPPTDPLGQSISHFHSKRRIPRMNSEEPPRA